MQKLAPKPLTISVARKTKTMSWLKPFQQIAKGELSGSSKDEGLCLVREGFKKKKKLVEFST